jgi:hypothetical protein
MMIQLWYIFESKIFYKESKKGEIHKKLTARAAARAHAANCQIIVLKG